LKKKRKIHQKLKKNPFFQIPPIIEKLDQEAQQYLKTYFAAANISL